MLSQIIKVIITVVVIIFMLYFSIMSFIINEEERAYRKHCREENANETK